MRHTNFTWGQNLTMEYSNFENLVDDVENQGSISAVASSVAGYKDSRTENNDGSTVDFGMDLGIFCSDNMDEDSKHFRDDNQQEDDDREDARMANMAYEFGRSQF